MRTTRRRMGLFLLACLALAGCRDNTPPPSGPAAVQFKVFVVRELGDLSSEPKDRIGYIWNDSQIATLMNDFIQNQRFLTGSQDTHFTWDGTIQVVWVSGGTAHIELPYTIYITQRLWAVANEHPNKMCVFFVPGIIDAADPTRFMPSFTLDDDHNNDPWWNGKDWRPMVLISDCMVPTPVEEPVEGMNPDTRMVSIDDQLWRHLVWHAVANFILRHDGESPNWDNHENWLGTDDNIMSRWNDRVKKAIKWMQQEIQEAIESGQWNQPSE